MKNIFLFLSLIFCITTSSLKAGNGLCDSAFSTGTISNPKIFDFSILPSQNEFWGSFIPTTNFLSIAITPDSIPTDTPTTHWHSLEIYQGTCNQLTLYASINIDTVFAQTGRTTALALLINSLITGNTYYFKLTRTGFGGCINCKNSISYFAVNMAPLNQNALSSTADCSGAIVVCSSPVTFPLGLGHGSTADIPASCTLGNPGPPQFSTACPEPGFCNLLNGGCLKAGEMNSTWLTFTVVSPGVLGFNFGAGTFYNGEFDWILYPYSGCSNIASSSVAPVSCNWNCLSVDAGGSGMGTIPFGGHPCNYECGINVTCGQQYIVCFSNFAALSGNVTMNFTGTASIGCSPSCPMVTVTSTGPECPGVPVTLTASPANATSYSWVPGNFTTQSITIAPTTATTYTVYVTNGSGTGSGFYTVNVLPAPSFNPGFSYNSSGNPFFFIPNQATICTGQSVYLFANIFGPVTYSWSPATGLNNTNTFHPIATPTVTTTYTITVTNSSGCSTSHVITVNVIDPPAFTVVTTKPSCNGQSNGTASVSFMLTNFPPFTYSWSPSGQTTSTATGLGAGTYTVTVTNVYGCSTSEIVILTAPAPVTINAPGISLCIGSSGQLTATASGGTGPYSYSWSPSNDLSNPNINNPIANPTTTTTYTVFVTDSKGCTGSTAVTVTVHPLPIVTITGSTTTCQVPATYCVTLPTSGSVAWNIPSGITYTVTNSSCIQVTNWGTFTSTGATLCATITDGFGCVNTGCFDVTSCCSNNSFPNYINDNTANIISNNSSAFVNTTFYINGTLTVNSNTVFNECKIFLGPGAQIIINNGRSLQILSQGLLSNCYSHLQAGCTTMWKGILVNPTAVLHIISPQKFATLIEDAETAITSMGGGAFDLRGVWFNKNHEDVLCLTFNGNHPGSILRSVFTCRNLSTVLSGCPPIFSSTPNTALFLNNLPTATLLAPFINQRSSTGFEAAFVQNFNLGIASTANTNIFDNHDYGVICGVSNMVIKNNRFQNITGPQIQLNQPCLIGTGICATGINFFNIIRSIVIGGATTGEGNSFDNCFDGIKINTNMNAQIKNNQFNKISTTAIGIFNSGNRTIDAELNTITDAYVGAYVYNCPKSNTTFFRNTISLTNTNPNNDARGIWIQDIAPVVGGSVSVTQNSASEMRFGIRFDNKSAPQIIDNSATLKNITNPNLFGSGISTWNCPNGAFVEDNHVFGHATAVCPMDVSCSSSYSCNNAVWWLNGIRIDNSNMSDVICNDVQDCGDGIFAGGSMINTSFGVNSMNGNLFRAFIGNWTLLSNQGTPTSGSDNIWNTTGTFAYNSYNLNPLVLNSAVVNCFRVQGSTGYNPGPNTGECSNLLPIPIHKFLFLPASGPSAVPCPVFKIPANITLAKKIITDSIPFNMDTIPNRLLSKLNVYHAMKLDSVLASNPALISFRDSLSNTSVGALDSVYNNMSIPMDASVSVGLSNLNSSATATDTITFWQKKVNHLALHNIAIGQNNYTPNELSKLRFIARRCPYRYGPVVYEARAILASVDPFITEYWNDCEIPTPPTFAGGRYAANTNSENKKSLVAKLYPNPTDGDFYYEYNLETGINGEITIIDMVGQIKFKSTLSSGDNVLKVTDKHLADGIYSVKVILSNGEEYVDKLIISK